MKKFREIMEMLSYDELLKLNKDLTPNSETKLALSRKIREIESAGNKTCATCGNLINPHFTEEYSLVFGPRMLKKRAFFCGIDCLEYFFINLKKISKKRLQSATK